MRRWTTRVAFVALVVLGSNFCLAQTELTLVPDWARLTLGPFVGITDDEARFFVDASLPFLGGVSGQLVEVTGTSLAGMQITIRLEPRLGLSAILGIGNIGTVWFQLADYPWEAITQFSFDFGGPKPVLAVGQVILDTGLLFSGTSVCDITRVEDDKLKARLEGDTWSKTFPRFAAKPDIKEKDAKGSPKYPHCTYIAVEEWINYAEPGDINLGETSLCVQFYHSDGTDWKEVGELVCIPAYNDMSLVPKGMKEGTYVLVWEKDGYCLYKILRNDWRSRRGVWKPLSPPSQPLKEEFEPGGFEFG